MGEQAQARFQRTSRISGTSHYGGVLLLALDIKPRRRSRRCRIDPRPGAVAQLVEHLLGRRYMPERFDTRHLASPETSVRFAMAS